MDAREMGRERERALEDIYGEGERFRCLCLTS